MALRLDKQYVLNFFLLFTILALLFGCGNPVVEEVSTSDDSSDTTSGFEIVTDSETAIEWCTFYTNSPDDYEKAYIYTIEDSYEDPFESFEAKIKKNSGNNNADFGLIFCYKNRSYIAFVIDVNGSYRVFKSNGGVISTIITWTSSSNLVQGYSSENILKVKQVSSNNFEIYINGEKEDTFTEASLVSGFNGYFVYIASEISEYLSTDPVEVQFASDY